MDALPGPLRISAEPPQGDHQPRALRTIPLLPACELETWLTKAKSTLRAGRLLGRRHQLPASTLTSIHVNLAAVAEVLQTHALREYVVNLQQMDRLRFVCSSVIEELREVFSISNSEVSTFDEASERAKDKLTCAIVREPSLWPAVQAANEQHLAALDIELETAVSVATFVPPSPIHDVE